MSTYVGVNVFEVEGTAAPTIQPAPTSVAAFVGATERGPANVPVRISEPSQFQARFGGPLASGYVALAVEGFFLNGGREAHVCRVVGAGSAPAFLTLNDRQSAAAPTLKLEGGYRGRPDPGAWAERIRVDVRDDPVATTAVAVTTGANATSAQLTSTADVRRGSVVRLTDSGGAVQFRKVTAVDPDRTVHWSGPVVAAINAASPVTTAEVRLSVRYRTSAHAELELVEEWPALSMESDSQDYVVDRINHPFSGSSYLIATDLSVGATGIENPAIVSSRPLATAVENAPGAGDMVGDAGRRTGLHALNGTAVQLLSVPDVHLLTVPTDRDLVLRGALDYCAARGDLMFVGAAPDRAHPTATVARARRDYTETESDYVNRLTAFGAALQAAKRYGALYAPWIRVADPAAPGGAATRFVPPDGHVMGVYAQTDLLRGIWKAPAGVGAFVAGALDVSAEFSAGQHDDLVRRGFVNGIRPTTGVGIVIAASRTLSTDTRWWYVNVRLLFNFVKSSLRDGLRFARQEPNSGELQRRVDFNVVRPFLLGLWRRGAFGSDPADQVFTVVCNATNNPAEEVALGNFHLDVTFYPVRPAETVVIKVGQQPSGGSASES